MTKKNITTRDDLVIKISILSNTLDTILIPKTGTFCYLEDRTAFFGLQLQEMRAGKFVDINPSSNLDNPPFVDSDTLTKGSQRLFEFPIGWLSQYPVGNYRIRILALFSLFNKMHDVSSNWANFEIKKPLKEH
jgi:hypothetical protein